ncbi:MAG: type II toxin-antitoxin system VapC family toxin [Opitutales bacterium]
MIAVDTNILVYAHRQDSEFHEPALAALRGLARKMARWAIPWPCVHEFLVITTHPKIFLPPSPSSIALQSIQVWLQAPGCGTIGETGDYFPRLQKIIHESNIRGPAVHDARIAAICQHHGISELWTADRDFSRFRNLKTINPLL